MAVKNNHLGGRRENHKFKALLVAQVLLKNSDEDHAIKTSRIIEHLEEYGINAEAHSVQRDIKALNELFEIDNAQQILIGAQYQP